MKFEIFATWNFETRDMKPRSSKSGDFEIWDLRFETWDFGIFWFKNWNLKFESLKLGIWKFETWNLKFWNLEDEILQVETLKFEIEFEN